MIIRMVVDLPAPLGRETSDDARAHAEAELVNGELATVVLGQSPCLDHGQPFVVAECIALLQPFTGQTVARAVGSDTWWKSLPVASRCESGMSPRDPEGAPSDVAGAPAVIVTRPGNQASGSKRAVKWRS